MKSDDRLNFLLQKLRHGTCSQAELTELKKRMSEEDGRIFQQYLDNDMDKQFNQIDERKSDKIWQSIFENIETEVKDSRAIIRKMAVRWAAAAVVVGVLVIAGLQIFYQPVDNQQTLLVVEHLDAAEPKLVQLPDGSKVWLNAHSRLIYPDFFSNNKREVKLEGQAFFEVSHDAEKPFLVATKNLTTTVLGTSFDINAYSKNESVEVSLFTGKVEVKNEADNKKWQLKPNEQLTYSSENKMGSVRTFNPEIYAIWRTGEMNFEDIPMADVVEVLKKQYPDATLEFSDDRLLTTSLSATFETSDAIEDILELICFSKGWELTKIKPNHYNIKE